MLPKQWTPQLTTLLSAVDQLSQEREPEAAFEYLHSQYVASAHSLSGLAGTPDGVADVLLNLAGTGASTFDFTSGTGSILRMAADRALQDSAVTRCYAQEINPQYALITLLRLWFVHLRAKRSGHLAQPPVVHIGDSLLADAMPDLRADVVVANFPFGIHDWGHDRLAYDPAGPTAYHRAPSPNSPGYSTPWLTSPQWHRRCSHAPGSGSAPSWPSRPR
ncbi:N-6 DNA methylase [Micromonospora sp. M12]